MRRLSISVLLLGLLAGCSGLNIGPHRIDVQQGNALDQDNVSRLKPGLTRSQVRFLLGTPLVVDPFHSDRWDYVYVFHKSGKLAEQRRLSLFFDGDSLARIEGNLPSADPGAQTATPQLAGAAAEIVSIAPATSGPAPEPAVRRVVPPLPSPPNAQPYVDPRVPAEPPLQAATDVTEIKPDVIPPFPEPYAAGADSDDPVLQALKIWADAWSRRDEETYLTAYDARFAPVGGDSRADWEKRRRLLLGLAKNIELKIDSPSVDRNDDGSATVTFNQYYRSDSYRDAVVKQLRMVERDGRWRIVEEKVLSILREPRS